MREMFYALWFVLVAIVDLYFTHFANELLAHVHHPEKSTRNATERRKAKH